MKYKLSLQFSAVADDSKTSKLVELQNRLDEMQNNGMTAMTMRDVLFHKMLDVYQVPSDHFLRKSETPQRIDDPSIINRLKQLGFVKKPSYQIH
ncbi:MULTISPECIES: hypothetical protein [unclassified Pseudoalteromonas]|uniref:hypothetical protein n=1 Tax=unclassified Pseudoalteromonas TaxID=194690 RepID=UPI000B3D42CE|nr:MULTISPECIES: hypothetical protein [unclassified Pseudoalteromonas]MDN3378130.1 hypothetical protein [Pseudoalteromonas sp. APC 3893]MDN3386895.1 hypothetical protein [Pseudoalteromonas sp. APC 4017]OUS74601.1 hypothetical protein B5G52_00960 [Pseudoalteromonas sp. A601]